MKEATITCLALSTLLAGSPLRPNTLPDLLGKPLRWNSTGVLVAPHDPLPLLAQLEQRAPQQFEVSYLERGPEAWRIQLVRRTP